MASVSGTEGYAAGAQRLATAMESVSFAKLHAKVLHLMPPPPGSVLDIGAGTGRDAAQFAAMGYQVVATEPVAELRMKAQDLHPSRQIEWLDDSLPDLASLVARKVPVRPHHADGRVDASRSCAAPACDAEGRRPLAAKRRDDPVAPARPGAAAGG